MAAKKETRPKRVRKAPFIIILVFLIMGIVGIMTGEVSRVLEQAVQVCLSCIVITSYSIHYTKLYENLFVLEAHPSHRVAGVIHIHDLVKAGLR